jgi:hypothetical protein
VILTSLDQGAPLTFTRTPKESVLPGTGVGVTEVPRTTV